MVFIVRLGILPPIFILYSILPLIFIDIIIIKRSAKNFYNVLFKTTGAYIYLVLPLSLSLYLIKYQHPSYNGTLLITILALIWVYDSFAYLIGSVLGKHKILPSISPKKSWEGLIGGYLFMSLAAYLFSTKILTDYKMYEIAIMCSIIVVAGTCGDFFESYLKRKSGLKDSGNCLPGHGGILDRFDSYFFIIPAIYLFLKLI